MTTTTTPATIGDLAQAEEIVNRHAPGPWTVGQRKNRRSMFPIRDANGKAVGYAYNETVAWAIVAWRGGQA